MKKSNKSVLILVSTCFIVSILLLLVFIFNVKRISKIDCENYTIVNGSNYDYRIENVIIENNKLTVEGFVYKKNEPVKFVATNLVLEDSKNTFYKLPTYVKYKEELANSDAGWAGFVSTFNMNKLDLTSDYQVYILSDMNGETSLIDLGISFEELLENAK